MILRDKRSANTKLAGGLPSNSALVSSKTQIYELGFVKVGYGFFENEKDGWGDGRETFNQCHKNVTFIGLLK